MDFGAKRRKIFRGPPPNRRGPPPQRFHKKCTFKGRMQKNHTFFHFWPILDDFMEEMHKLFKIDTIFGALDKKNHAFSSRLTFFAPQANFFLKIMHFLTPSTRKIINFLLVESFFTLLLYEIPRCGWNSGGGRGPPPNAVAGGGAPRAPPYATSLLRISVKPVLYVIY